MSILLFADDLSTWSWQGFILLNLAGIVGLSFWLGSLGARLERLDADRKELAELLKKEQEERAEEVQRMRSAYHRISGFIMALHPEWQSMDIDSKR